MGENLHSTASLNSLSQLNTPDTKSCKAVIYKKEDFDALSSLISEKSPVLHDEYAAQMMELHKIRHPEQKFSQKNLQTFFDEWSQGRDLSSEGIYVYYPWSNKLVHIVSELEFVELRTSRNKHKIKEEEQEHLSQRVIGVIGLSVGQSVALTLAMERTFGKLRIADFDTLELTNLNRIRSGIANMGLPKTVVVAREIAEIDPFLEVEIFGEGITEENIGSFLENEGERLDLLIEECDSLPVKILCREEARKLGIPVIMDTSDRGMIDVERFDLDKTLPLLHGYCGIESLAELKALSPEDQMRVMMKMVDFENLSSRMKYSFGELGKSLSTWPQLASDVIAGGGNTAKLARMIILGEEVPSGRYYFDVCEQLIRK